MIIGDFPEDNKIIKKAIVDSDMDGVTCASLLKSIFGDIKIVLTEPKFVQQGLLDGEADDLTVVADLRFINGCGLYFDHHIYNKPEHKFLGLWEDAPSCSGIIYEAYKSKVNLGKYESLVRFVDCFDSGAITKEEVENPEFLLDLAFAITRRDKSFGKVVAEGFWKMDSIDDFKKMPIISSRIEEFKSEREDYLEYLKTHVDIEEGVAFVENRGFNSDIAHAFFVNALYPDTDAVVMIKGDNKDPNRINLSISRNNFNKNGKEHNFLPIVGKLNPKVSGGHKFACGVAIPKGMALDEAKRIILNMLKKY